MDSISLVSLLILLFSLMILIVLTVVVISLHLLGYNFSDFNWKKVISLLVVLILTSGIVFAILNVLKTF